MKSLYTLLVILTVGIASAQSRIVVSQTSFEGDSNTYTHIKGAENNADTCFTATSSSTIIGAYDGLNIDTITIDSDTYSWTGPDARATAEGFIRWVGYNEIYRNRGSQRPIHVPNSDLLRCDGWSLDSSGQWYTNPGDFQGYAYNEVIAPAANGLPAIHTPQLVFGYDGSHPDLRLIADGGQRIYVGSFQSAEDALAGVLLAIDGHRNPVTQPEEEEEEESTAVDQWNQGTVQGFIGWGERTRQAWSNDIYPGYAYNTWENRYVTADEWFVRVGIYDRLTDSWTQIDIQGVYSTEADADAAARRYISENFVDSFPVETPLERLASALSGSVPNRGHFIPSDFVTDGHANPGWLRGDYQNGLTVYNVTAPSRSSNVIEVSWIHTDNRGWGYTNRPNHTIEVVSTIQYVSWDGSIHNNIADLPAGSHTEIHTYEQSDIDAAQAEGVRWAIAQLNMFVGS